jgi:hypothetical protein
MLKDCGIYFCVSVSFQTPEFDKMHLLFLNAMEVKTNQGRAKSANRLKVMNGLAASQGRRLYDVVKALGDYKKDNAKVRYLNVFV